MLRQRTLRQKIATIGIGLHSGTKVQLTMRPAPPDTGIVFRRLDLSGQPSMLASALAVGDTRLASTLQQGDAKVSTVEHLMSACAGLGIDNLYVDLTAEEIPIMDGSAGSFVFLLQSAGIEEQAVPKKFIRVLKSIEIRDGDKWARLDPYFGFKLKFSIDFNHPAIDSTGQVCEIDFAEKSYVREVARARTFGFMQDVEYLRNAGLARGGSLDNAIVMDEYRILNNDGLRYADEFVKHKILDAVGDLYLAGHALIGAYTGHKSGHGMNNRLLRALFDDVDAYEVINFADAARAPEAFTQGLGRELASI